jgi:CRP-like cAMP-binding protein
MCIMFKTYCGDLYFDWLRSIELFADCSDRELAEVMRFATVLDVPAGRTLTRQGDVGRECFVTTEGGTSIERNGIVSLPTRGEVVGELALLDHAPRTATVTTSAPTRVLVMSQREFTSLYRLNIANITPRIEAMAEAHRAALGDFAQHN